MRILHLVHQYMPEYVGGTELYTRWLTQAQAQRGHQAAIFYRRSADGVGREARSEGRVRIWAAWNGVVSPTRRFFHTFRDPRMASLWEQTLDEFDPHLVHIEHLMGLPVALVRTVQQRRIPYVITLCDFWWVCANAQLLTNDTQTICDGPQGYWNCARCALARVGRTGLWPARPPLAGLLAWRNRQLRSVLQCADALLAPTPFVHHWYAAHHAPQERLMTLPLGMEHPDPPMPVPLTGRPLRFAYIGGLAPQKGVHTLIAAFAGLRLQGDAELWIAGDESFDPAYVARLRELANGAPVRFLGRLSRSAVWETLSQVDVVAVPSLWYETFSFIISEAFIARRPVIASRLGALADRVRDGVDGQLLPPGDVLAWRAALQRLVDAPDMVVQWQANVRPPITLEAHGRQIEALYARILEEAPPR